MKGIRVAVVAGTPIDTKMGVDFLKSKGMLPSGYPVSQTPEEQSALQILDPLKLEEEVRAILRNIRAEGIDNVMIYCNSMSAAVDMEKLSVEENMNIITPFAAYKMIAKEYDLIGVLAANCQSSAGIEKIIQNENPQCSILGIGMLPLVVEIENGTLPEKIIEKFSLKQIIDFYKLNKVDAIILGCTHFPYLCKELEKYTDIPIIDPAELMYQKLAGI